MSAEPCTGGAGCGIYLVFFSCKKHGTGCTCQSGPATPLWYISVKTCPHHAHLYDPSLAPEWWDVAANDLRRP